jgi:predicted Zn-dependent peptidase
MKHTVSEVELKNGAKGLFIDIPGASVTTYELNFRAGEFLVPRKKWEVPHLLEHVIASGGNEAYPDRQIFQAEIGKNGADLNAYTSYYYIAYIGEVADFEWDRVLKLQLRSLDQPLFLHHEFESEFGNIRDELAALSNNHFRHLDEAMDQSFKLNVVTDKERGELIKNVTREDLIDHYHQTHYTHNMRFIVAGSLRGRRAELRRVLEGLNLPKGGSRLKFPAEMAKKPRKTTFIPNETVENIYFQISSYYNSYISQEEDDALALVRIMLTDTLYSKIFGKARDQGLVYSVGSTHRQMHKYSEWLLRAQVMPVNAPSLCDIILTEVKNMQNGIIDDSELEAAKQYALGSFQKSLQTVGAVASAYSRYFFDDHVEDMRSVPARVKAITKEDISKAMNMMFSGGLGSVGVLGGTDDTIADQLHDQLQPLWR